MKIETETDFRKGTIFIDDLKIGMTRYVTRKVYEKDINAFAEISGDQNPVHLNEEFASNTVFEKKIAHGMLTASFISAVIGEYLRILNIFFFAKNSKQNYHECPVGRCYQTFICVPIKSTANNSPMIWKIIPALLIYNSHCGS